MFFKNRGRFSVISHLRASPIDGMTKNVLSFKNKPIVNHLILTKRTVICHLNWARWIQKDHEIWGCKCTFGLEQPQTCCEFKPVDEIPILPSGYLDLHRQCINKQAMKTMNISASTTKLHIITKKNGNISRINVNWLLVWKIACVGKRALLFRQQQI